jgi:hypothetical protein
MIENYIKEALDLNKLDLEKIDGYKLYYSKIKSIISLLINTIMIGGGLFLFISDKRNGSALLGLLFVLFFIFSSLAPIGRLILKNPVFILTSDKIYYIKTNQWYSLKEYDFDDALLGSASASVYLAFSKKNNKGNVEFKERHWHLESGDEFRKMLKYYKLLLNRN